MSFVVIFSSKQELIFQTNFNIIPKSFKFECMKKIENVECLFQKLIQHKHAEYIHDTIKIKFRTHELQKECLHNFQLFYPNYEENLHDDTQHLMQNEIVYSVIDGKNILMGELNLKNDIICCERHFTFEEFIQFHYQLVNKKLHFDKISKLCKIKRNGNYFPLIDFLHR